MGNTVGSLSEVLHAIVVGSLLGDGSMRGKTNALLEINHSVRQRSYVDWKFSHLDDGCRSRNAVYLNTQQFDMKGQQVMLELLREQWGLDARLNRDKSYHRIRISVTSTKRLAKVIEPYLLSELRYKLPQVTP